MACVGRACGQHKQHNLLRTLRETQNKYWIWGILAVVTYGLIAFMNGNTGEWSLNWLYYLPTSILGYFVWKKNEVPTAKTGSIEAEVESKKLNFIQSLMVYGGSAVAIYLFARLISLPLVNQWFYGTIFQYGFDKYLIDSFTTVLSVVSEVLLIKRYREQWILWILVDVMSVVLWCYTFDLMMILMWSTLLVNAVYGWLKWRVK